MTNLYPPYQPYPTFQNPVPQQPMQPFPNQQVYQQPTQPQIQNAGFIQVRSEREAYEYPIAPGNSLTFKDEYSPYVYVKTLGFNQMERPIFKRYRLIEEEVPTTHQNSPVSASNSNGTDTPNYALKSELDTVSKAVIALKSEIDKLKEKTTEKQEETKE